MGFLNKKKSSPSLPSGSSSSSRPPPLPTSKSSSPSSSSSRPSDSRYTPSPSLSSLAAQDHGGGLDAPLKIHERFASRSSSFADDFGSRSTTPTTDFSRGVADPRMGGGSLRGGGAGIGRDEEAALLAARKRRMVSEGAEGGGGSMRSGRSNHEEGGGGGAEHLRGRFKSEASPVDPDVKFIQIRKRRATESKGSTEETQSSTSPSPSTSRARPVLKSTTGSSSSSYVLPISIPRPPTPPPPSPEKITFSRSNSSNPPPLDRSISFPANPRDSVITFNSSSSSSKHVLHSSAYQTTSPPPLPQNSYPHSPAPESTSDAWKAAHDIVLRRGNSAYSYSSTTPPFSPPLAPVHNPPLSSPSSLDALLSSAGPVRRKKWDPLAAFGGGDASPGPTSSPSTGLAVQGMGTSKESVSIEGASLTTQHANGRGGDQWSPPRRDAPSAKSSEASRRAEASSDPLISKSRSSLSSGSYETYEPWSRSQEDHSSSRKTGTVSASPARPLPPRQLPSMPVAVPAAQPTPPPPQQTSFSTHPTPPTPHSILKKKSRSDSSSTQSSLPDVLPPPPPLHPRELTSHITPPTPPPNSISATKLSTSYPTPPPVTESTSFEARASRSGSGSGITPSPISIPASKTKEKFVALNSPIAPYLQPVSKEAPALESQSRTTRKGKRMASPPSATSAGFGGREDGGDEGGMGLVKSEEKAGQKILRRMGSFGFGRGGVEGGDATLISSLRKPPGSPTTSVPRVQTVTPFFRGSDATESSDETPPSPDSYFSTFSPTPIPPPGLSSSLPPQEEKIDPFEKGAPRSPTTKSSKSNNVTVSLLRSNGTNIEPKGPNNSRVLQPTAELTSSSNHHTSRAPSPNGLPRSPRPSPKASPSSSPKLLPTSELPSAPPSPRTTPSTARPLPPQAPLPSSTMLPKTPLELQSVQVDSLPKNVNVVVRPLPQPTPPAPAATTHALRPLPEPARQPLPLLKTNLGGGGSIGARKNFFEQAGATKPSTSDVVRQEKETPRRDSALMPNSPPLTPQPTPILDQVSSPSSSVGSPASATASSSNHTLQSLPVRALPGQSPPPPPPSSIIAAASPPSQRGYESLLLLPDTRPEPSSSDHGSDYNHHWSASSANSSSTTVESSTPPSSVSTPVFIPRVTPAALRGTPPSSFLPSSVPSAPSSSYSPPSADFSPHLPAVLDSSSPFPQDETKPSYPLVHHIGNKVLFETLLRSLSFETWLNLYSTTRAIRRLISLDRDLREVVMERFLRSVGYQKWEPEFLGPETLALTPNDLNAYLRCVSIPVHEFANSSQAVLSGQDRDPSTVPLFSALNRHYSRVVARIKLQAAAQVLSVHKARKRSSAFASSGAASIRGSSAASIRSLSVNKTGVNFSSPLYRLNHALLVRVFVPSPEGPWLSDASVVACENELKTAGIFSILKAGDCVWNTAINEEGNAGYLLFDGYYLVDLDFQFSVMGEIPSFIDTFKFPPSYWHKVVKAAGNPLLYLDLSGPMGVEIKRNTKLILDKAPLAAPDGRERLVQSWIHRSELVLRETKGMIHADWAGMLVILTQGTNEAVADLARRLDRPGKTPFRLLRERSRPGEIWIRPVLQEESLLARG